MLDLLLDLGLPLEQVDQGAFLVRLRGYWVWLIEGEQDVSVEVFVMHVLPSASPALSPHLLFRNRSLRRVHYALDEVGDVYLVGSFDASAEALDRVLGELVLELNGRLLTVAYGSDVPEKALLDGAGRRMAGVPGPRRDARR